MGEKKRRPRGQLVPLEGDPETCRTWGVRVPLKERAPSGRHKTHYETLYDTTEAKAEKYKEKLLARIDAGLFFRPAPLTVSALIDEWLAQEKREDLSPASLYTYTDAADAYLRPHVGHLQLGELTPLAVRNLYNTLQDRKLSTRTIRYARTVLNLILRAAVTWRYLKENPAEGIKPPKGTEGRAAHVMNVEEARALIEAASLDPHDLVFVFALATGMRPEEYLGLTWPHVAFDSGRGVAQVRQVAMKIRGGGWELHKPKTKKAVRDVPFPASLYRELLRFKELEDGRARVVGSEWQDFQLVFPGSTGAPMDASWLNQSRFSKLLKRAGLATHFTLYSLRYTYATLQFLVGERDRVVSDLMGHVKVDFTKDVYTKVLPSMREQASDSLEKLLFDASRTTLAQPTSELPM